MNAGLSCKLPQQKFRNEESQVRTWYREMVSFLLRWETRLVFIPFGSSNTNPGVTCSGEEESTEPWWDCEKVPVRAKVRIVEIDQILCSTLFYHGLVL